MKNIFIFTIVAILISGVITACGGQNDQQAISSAVQESTVSAFAGERDLETSENDYVDLFGAWAKISTGENAAEVVFLNIDSDGTVTTSTGSWEAGENGEVLYTEDAASGKTVKSNLIDQGEDGAFLEIDGKTYQYHSSNDTVVNTDDANDFYERNWQNTDMEAESKKTSPVRQSLLGKWFAGSCITTNEDEPLIVPQTDHNDICFYDDGTVSFGKKEGIYAVKGNIVRISVDDGSHTLGFMSPDGMFSDDTGGDFAHLLLNQDHILLYMEQSEFNADEENVLIATAYAKNQPEHLNGNMALILDQYEINMVEDPQRDGVVYYGTSDDVDVWIREFDEVDLAREEYREQENLLDTIESDDEPGEGEVLNKQEEDANYTIVRINGEYSAIVQYDNTLIRVESVSSDNKIAEEVFQKLDQILCNQ